jgi:hypothetical protein
MDDFKQPNIRFYRYVTLWDFKRTSFNPKSNDPFGEMLRQDFLDQPSKPPQRWYALRRTVRNAK